MRHGKIKRWTRHYRVWTAHGQWIRWSTVALFHQDYLLHLVECRSAQQ